MLQNALLLLAAGHQQDAMLSPCPALQPVQWLSWLRGVPPPGQPCSHPCSSTPRDGAGREWGASLLFIRNQRRWEIIKKKTEEVACKTKATLEIKDTLTTLAQASPPFPACLLPYL